MAYAQVADDEFAAFANRAEEEAEAQKNRNNNGGFEKTYEEVKWLYLDKAAGHILRLVGRPPASMKPGSHVDPTDAHEIFFSKIKDDTGHQFELKLPMHSDDPNHEHIMWRIINKATEVKYRRGPDGKVLKGSDGKALKDYIHEGKTWLPRVLKGGFVETDSQYKFNKGWAGQQILLVNCIDREDNWCAEHKHTKLLSKGVSYGKDANGNPDYSKEYPTKGVPSYGVCSLLSTMVNTYQSWEKYDIQLRPTGQTSPSMELLEAGLVLGTPMAAKIAKGKEQFVSRNPCLTPEELEYERYDIEKFFAPTSYQKLLSKLGNTIKAIDADLNTRFYEELTALAAKEKADWEALHANDAPADTQSAPVAEAPTFVPTDDGLDPYSQPIPTSAPIQEAVAPQPTVATPARAVAPAMQNIGTLAPSKIALLKGWGSLTDDEKAGIVDVVTTPDGQAIADIVYKDAEWTLCSCPADFGDGVRYGCGKNSPDFYTTCPSCGVKF